ncbi:uncharacterized protein LOC142344154 [Convolutriloba macropyga]|uniref:uncharacterized protein LOC142344154 n=1 Tax=Convolutriloba macropyga TaxID=536237 RepID=UPI003F51EBDD
MSDDIKKSNPADEEDVWLRELWASKTKDAEKEFYDRTAADYETVMSRIGWSAPTFCVKVIENYIAKSGKELNKSSVKVLDVGAGSGLSGIALREAGFSGTIDALEPSEMMFAQAKPKNIYTQYFSDFLIGAQETSVPSGEYDLVISVGVFSDRSVKSESLFEVARMTKPGGLIATLMVKDWFDNTQSQFQDTIRRLEEDKVATMCHSESIEGVFDKHAAAGFILQKI